MEAMLVVWSVKHGANADAKDTDGNKSLSCAEANLSCDQSVLDALERVGDEWRKDYAECVLTDRRTACFGAATSAAFSAFFVDMDLDAYGKGEILVSSVPQWAAECGGSGDVCGEYADVLGGGMCSGDTAYWLEQCQSVTTGYPLCLDEYFAVLDCTIATRCEGPCDEMAAFESCSDEHYR